MTSITLSDFDYPLPKELIAQKPLAQRDASRLLVVHRHNGKLEDRHFSDLPEYVDTGDVLVLNDTKVFKARILGKKKLTGGKVDILLLELAINAVGAGLVPAQGRPQGAPLQGQNVWRCLVQPGLKEGQVIEFPGDVEGVHTGRDADGTPIIEFKNTSDVRVWAEKAGTMPLPPYIKREADDTDIGTYQTIYAEKEGAVAAPTAGLHFTRELLEKLRKKGIQTAAVTLHVGYGTFKPVEDLENHRMHAESFELTEETAARIAAAKKDGKKTWAVGTTTLRVLETCVRKGSLAPGRGQTDLFIQPPFEFEAVDRLITNFHLPKTTLLLLVSAFMGEALRKKAYEHAIEKKYRFYSYGDAMVIL